MLANLEWVEPIQPRPWSSRRNYRILKRVMDFGLSAILLPFAVVLGAVIALAIWVNSPGPALYVQYRTGRGGQRFRMLKFRTMVSNAEQLKANYAHLNVLSWPDFKLAQDPRVTKVGQFLRRTSLDELPQLINVLRGEMSLVGPRPTSFEAGTYSLWHTQRLEVLPGITGLWQVSGRADLDFNRRVELDIAYLERQSLGLDIQILFRTFSAVLSGRGAY